MTPETTIRQNCEIRSVTGHQFVEYPLGEIAMVQQGYTFSPDYQGQAEGKWPYVKVGDLNAHGNTKYLDRTFNYVDDNVLEEMGAEPFPSGSIVFPRVGAALRNNNKRILRQASLTDDNVIVVTVRDTCSCSAEYLYYWFDFQDLQRFCNDGTVPVINGRSLKRQCVQLPTFELQQRISSLLSAWDTAIQKTGQLIAAKTARKSGLMTALLSGRRRVGRFQTKWRRWHLGELFRERAESDRGDLPLLSIAREEGVVPRDGIDRKDTSSEDKSKYLRICPGDIGYNTMRMWQGVSALSRHEGIVSPAYTICIPGPEIDGTFASYLFKLPEVIHLFYRYSQGLTSDTWNLKFHHFASIRVHIPEPEEQIAIASILAGLDEELALLKSQREALSLQKRGLMQKLLTGQWQLSIAKEATA